MSRGPDASTLVERALTAAAGRAGSPVTIADSTTERWASVTFAGARHMLTLTAPCSDALDQWIAALPDEEFELRGHLVADLSVARIHRHDGHMAVALEVLTVEVR